MIKKNDFVELEFTATIKDDNVVFDTTSVDVAKKHGLFDEHAKFEPIVVCVGQNQVLPGLDMDLPGKDIGKEYTIEIQPENAFGKKSAKLIQLVPTRQFTKQKITPMPGLQVNIDNHMGTIKTVTGGRTLVDFNHPLSSKVLIYEYKINKLIDEPKAKLDFYLRNTFGLPAETSVEGSKATIKLNIPLPEEISKAAGDKIKEIISEVKEVVFEAKTPVKKADGQAKDLNIS